MTKVYCDTCQYKELLFGYGNCHHPSNLENKMRRSVSNYSKWNLCSISTCDHINHNNNCKNYKYMPSVLGLFLGYSTHWDLRWCLIVLLCLFVSVLCFTILSPYYLIICVGILGFSMFGYIKDKLYIKNNLARTTLNGEPIQENTPKTTTRPIPEILEELDEAVEERDA